MTIARPLTRGLLLLIALPGILQAFMQAPAQTLVQGIYAKESGLLLATLGTAIIVVRLVDLCTDMLIGFLSDRAMARGIGRKPWIAAGTTVSIIAIWFWMRPPEHVTAMYYATWFMLANLGWSLVEIPYKSWCLEYTPEPSQRARVMTWIALTSTLGAVCFYAIAPLGKSLGVLETAAPDMKMLGFAAVVIALLTPLPVLLTLLCVPDSRDGAIAPPATPPPAESLPLLLKSVASHVPLLRFLLCLAICAFMYGLPGGVLLLYLTNYLGLAGEATAVLMLSIPVSMLGIPFWGLLAQRYERQRVWACGMGLAGLGYIGVGLLEPGVSVALVGALSAWVSFGILSIVVSVPVIMGDNIDYAREKFGVERAALYISIQGQVNKGTGALAGGAGLVLLGLAGFDATRSGAQLTAHDISLLKWIVAWVPAMGLTVCGALVWALPISRESRERAARRAQARGG